MKPAQARVREWLEANATKNNPRTMVDIRKALDLTTAQAHNALVSLIQARLVAKEGMRRHLLYWRTSKPAGKQSNVGAIKKAERIRPALVALAKSAERRSQAEKPSCQRNTHQTTHVPGGDTETLKQFKARGGRVQKLADGVVSKPLKHIRPTP